MSLGGRLMRALLRAVPIDREQFAEESAVHRAANVLAESSLSDEEAKIELQAVIASHSAGVEPTLELLGQMRDDYVRDRAYRLLRAAADDGPVETIAPESAELFSREEELGRMPIRDGFALLKGLEPAIGDLERDVSAGRLTAHGKGGLRSVNVPLGRAVAHTDPLLRSDLALSIARHYLEVLAGDDRLGGIESPYFGASPKRSISSGVLFGRPQPPPGHRD